MDHTRARRLFDGMRRAHQHQRDRFGLVRNRQVEGKGDHHFALRLGIRCIRRDHQSLLVDHLACVGFPKGRMRRKSNGAQRWDTRHSSVRHGRNAKQAMALTALHLPCDSAVTHVMVHECLCVGMLVSMLL